MKDCLLTIVMPSCNIQDYISKGLESFQQVLPNDKKNLKYWLSWMVNNSERSLKELYRKIEQSSYKYVPTKKFARLSYLNYRTNFALGIIFNPILKKYSEKKEKERGV